MKLLQPITGTVERLEHDGSGVIPRPEGKPFLVYNTIPGETVNATTLKRTPDGIKSRLESVVTASPDRVAPRCPFAGTCGGCKWQHIDYVAQTRLKLDLMQRDFAAAGVSPAPSAVQACPDPFYYRNRMDYVFGRHGELGLKQPDKWWETLDITTCFLESPEATQILSRVREWSRGTGLPFWDSKTHQGFFRYVVIREGKRTGERLVMLVTALDEGRRTQDEGLMKQLPDLLGDLATSIVWGINSRITDVSFADEIVPLKGEPLLHEEIGGVRYEIAPNAFFQTNTVMGERLQAKVADFCGDLTGKTLLDLYCGSGFFSLFLAPRAAKTVGIELDESGIVAAKRNAQANGRQVEYFASKAEAFDWTGYKPDVVILDPPRAGMHPDVIKTLLEVKPPTLVYVSCKYTRFLEEMKQLGQAYDLVDSAALDLFPHTPHVEGVFKLVRK